MFVKRDADGFGMLHTPKGEGAPVLSNRSIFLEGDQEALFVRTPLTVRLVRKEERKSSTFRLKPYKK